MNRQTRGQALIIALIFIVLCTILAVAFFTNVTTAGLGERAMVSEATASQLALTAVQLMEGTIGFATESGTYPTVAWACQPGMIRTYGGPPAGGGSPTTANLQASAAPLAYYKLYSSSNMIVTGTTTTAFAQLNNPATIFAADIPSTWDQNPAFFTDLNSPITSGTATVFPIVDPRAADSDIAVGGFSYTTGTNTTSNGATIDGINTSGTTNTYANDSTSRLPMPVAWMYVLRNGSLTTPDTGSGNSAQWSSSASNPPSSTNPIVGRIAFWTDDECSKVNINTASEGTYWDTPVCNSGSTSDIMTSGTVAIGDDTLAMVEPVQHEYQRYPGHPATTCLSAVFGTILNSSAYGDTAANRAQMVKSITDTIPRVSDYGSGVTGYNAPSGSAYTTLGGTVAGGTSSSAPSVVVDQDRLYASLDEYQFSPYYSGTTGASGTGTRIAQTFLSNASQSGSNETLNYVDTCRFFLTAHSKAPELNMFGLPRVSIWPLWDTTNAPSGTTLTQFDSEILRCSTLNVTGTNNDPHYFCFFRYNPTSPTNDFPTTTGTTPTVNRNPSVFNYLKNLMGQNVPGFGFSFSAKYGATDTIQILAEIFDYIRSTNLADHTTGAVPYTTGTDPSTTGTNFGQVVPIQITGTGQGFGRTSTIEELALALVKIDDRATTSAAESTTNLASSIKVTGSGASGISTVNTASQTLLEWTLIPGLSSPSCGYVPLINNVRIRFTSVNLTIGGTNTGSLSYPALPDFYDVGEFSNSRDASAVGGPLDPLCLLQSSSPRDSMYPTGLVVAAGTTLTGQTNTMMISGTVTANLYTPSGAIATPNQQFTFVFPPTKVPIPNLNSGSSWVGAFRGGTYTPGTTGTFSYPAALISGTSSKNPTRLNTAMNPGSNFLGSEGTDTVRSLTATGTLNKVAVYGDLRLVAVSSTIPASTFQLTGTAPSSIFNTNVSCLREGQGVQTDVPGFAGATLLSTVPASSWGKSPGVPPPTQSGTAGIPTQGDWDNGMGLTCDGPWIDKPDEGMTITGGGNSLAHTPYLGAYQAVQPNGAPLITEFSPNRQISSPVMFGSLPVGTDHSWETLLFRPATLPGYHGTYTHPGNASPVSFLPDHLLLDLFWMPIVEPYGISEPLATSGKINLNTQIAPFTYITRTTGLNAVLKSVMITALSSNYAASGKNSIMFQTSFNAEYPAVKSRYPIDANQTIGQMTTATPDSNTYPEFSRTSHTLAAPNFFVSATQICDVPLIPLGYTPANLSSFWTTNSLTGDNSLERPYSMIYPRVTTKSNIFTVHVIAQSLKQTPSDLANGVNGNGTWTENVDQVMSEFHGAFTIEKYYDPDTTDITTVSLGKFKAVTAANDGLIQTTSPYTTAAIRGAKWRLLSVKRFGQ